MKIAIYDQAGDKTPSMAELHPRIFELKKLSQGLVHQIVVAQLANRRRPFAHTKTRGEVRGGGKKPWQQKGTGRARAGSIRSPLWRGGGIIFGPRPERNFYQKINKKMKRQGLFTVLSDKAQSGRLLVLDDLEMGEGKTRELQKKLQDLAAKAEGLDLKKRILLIIPQKNAKLEQAARNLPQVKINTSTSLNILDLLAAETVIIFKDALPIIEKTYLK